MAKKRRVKRRKSNPKRRRRRRVTRKRNPTRRRRRRVSRKRNPVRRRRRRAAPKRRRRRRRRRNPWYDQPIRHSRAAKRGWKRRRQGKVFVPSKGHKVRLKTSKGKFYKKPDFTIWRNPNGVNDIAVPLALASVGFLGSFFLLNSQMVKEQTSKLSPGMQKWIPVALPIGVAALTMMYAPRVAALRKYSKHIYFLSFGLAVAGGVAGLKNVLAGTDMGTKMGMSGYVSRPGMRGYVRSMRGYVTSRGMGQMEERAPRLLGAPVKYRGGRVPSHAPGMKMVRATGYQPVSEKPYGLGLPQSERRYNEFSWRGAYDKGVYE